MDLFVPTFGRMIYLFVFILAGYLLIRFRVLKPESAGVLSKLENTIFIPALVMGTLMENFTVAQINQAWKMLLFSLAIALVNIPLAILFGRIFGKDTLERNIIAYGLAFSNFGFMGNAVVESVFPELFADYLIFTLVLWVIIYGWAVPAWLIPKEEGKKGSRLKNLVNPMFIGTAIGLVLGLTGIHKMLPSAVGDVFTSIVSTAGSCMSPVAMILTGITVASVDLKKTVSSWSIYAITFLRLVVFPLAGLGIFSLFTLPRVFVICAVCALAMPLGLSPVVIPAGYGKDTSKAAAMTLVSHVVSVITIPLIFILMSLITK